MKYILIWYILQGSTTGIQSGGMSVGAMEFNDLKSCEIAGEQIKKWNFNTQFMCVEKGE